MSYQKIVTTEDDSAKQVTATVIPLVDLQHQGRTTTNLGQNEYIHQERPLWLTSILLFVDVILALSPLLFVGIAVAAIIYNKRPIAEDTARFIGFPNYGGIVILGGGNMVIQIAHVAVSIFPILFAAIAGRFLKAYALHRAERGSQMGILEQLYGSQSLSNAVQLSFALRGPGLVGIGVVVLWLLSPLGGQGVQRVLETTQISKTGPSTVFYADTSSEYSKFAYRQTVAIAMPAMNALLASSLLTNPIADEFHDVWGNVRIPYLDSLKPAGTDVNRNSSQWYRVDDQAASSSLIGLTMNNVTSISETTLNITTSYISLQCQDGLTFTYTQPGTANPNGEIPANMSGYQQFLHWLGPVLTHEMTNDTQASLDKPGLTIWSDWQYLVDLRTSGISANDSSSTKSYLKPLQLIFAVQSFTGSETSGAAITAYECGIEMQWVQVSIFCAIGDICSPVQMRAIPQPSRISTNGMFADADTLSGEQSIFARLLSFLNGFDSFKTYGVQVWGPASTISLYMTGSEVYNTDAQVMTNTTILAREVASRLGTLINTAWLISLQYTRTAAPGITNSTLLTAADPDSANFNRLNQVNLGYDVRSVQAQAKTYTAIYRTNWIWVSVAVIISGVLFALGIMGLYFRHTNRHPDVLGFVSTLIRDNPNFDLPPQAEKLDGLEIASYYKHTVVQLVTTGSHNDDQARITLKQQKRSAGDL